MNPLLSTLQLPFERLRQLFADITPTRHLPPLAWALASHATPRPFIGKPLDALDGLGNTSHGRPSLLPSQHLAGGATV
jgi:hypothetical protein